MGVPHFIVVEPNEVDLYAKACKGTLATVIELDMSYKRTYELCDDLGLTKSTGPGPARNFIWDHSIAHGHEWHWVMDDNIRNFQRTYRNRRIELGDGMGFKAMEDFVLRYRNIGMAGPNYRMFVPSRSKLSPFVKNTRIYSCNLIRNDLKYRWRGRYNEDTILSLDMLKGGWCTVQFNAFLQDKLHTQILGGGNTAEFYAKEGTLPKSKMLVQEHPDVSRLSYRYGREHHFVDYGPFKRLKLILREDVEIPSDDTYKMKLKRLK